MGADACGEVTGVMTDTMTATKIAYSVIGRAVAGSTSRVWTRGGVSLEVCSERYKMSFSRAQAAARTDTASRRSLYLTYEREMGIKES